MNRFWFSDWPEKMNVLFQKMVDAWFRLECDYHNFFLFLFYHLLIVCVHFFLFNTEKNTLYIKVNRINTALSWFCSRFHKRWISACFTKSNINLFTNNSQFCLLLPKNWSFVSRNVSGNRQLLQCFLFNVIGRSWWHYKDRPDQLVA